MNFREQPYNKHIESQIEQILREFKKLRQRIEVLSEENLRLKEELKEIKDNSQGLPHDQLSESQRLAMRQQINGLINKIDQYLGGS